MIDTWTSHVHHQVVSIAAVEPPAGSQHRLDVVVKGEFVGMRAQGDYPQFLHVLARDQWLDKFFGEQVPFVRNGCLG